ncbi:TetR/AcrR family transcriptional regulator [Piscinibacter aquaticus]|uniref:TetR/AcrR family transcriptional regulator n=1 Tax=Piscinibacter aquaticus TaxID=392597 RepID=A0A5C6TZ06_9BURK|nr:TetR/AcrR family transcriptional regulator [Piscinibacter aquaticus]
MPTQAGTLLTSQSLFRCPPPSSHPTRRASAAKEARPQELIDAALELFAEKGFAATRSEEVAARAGVAKGTLYLYYPSKEELLKAVISQRLSSEIVAVTEYANAFQGSCEALLRDVFTEWWSRVFDSPTSAVFKLVITEVRNFPEIAAFYRAEVVEPATALVGEIVERGVRSGEFAPVDVRGAVMSLVFPMIMLCLHKHSLGACAPATDMMEPHAFIRQHVELVLHGLRAHPTSTAGADA